MPYNLSPRNRSNELGYNQDEYKSLRDKKLRLLDMLNDRSDGASEERDDSYDLISRFMRGEDEVPTDATIAADRQRGIDNRMSSGQPAIDDPVDRAYREFEEKKTKVPDKYTAPNLEGRDPYQDVFGAHMLDIELRQKGIGSNFAGIVASGAKDSTKKQALANVTKKYKEERKTASDLAKALLKSKTDLEISKREIAFDEKKLETENATELAKIKANKEHREKMYTDANINKKAQILFSNIQYLMDNMGGEYRENLQQMYAELADAMYRNMTEPESNRVLNSVKSRIDEVRAQAESQGIAPDEDYVGQISGTAAEIADDYLKSVGANLTEMP